MVAVEVDENESKVRFVCSISQSQAVVRWEGGRRGYTPSLRKHRSPVEHLPLAPVRGPWPVRDRASTWAEKETFVWKMRVNS